MAHTIVIGDTHMDWISLVKTLYHFRPKVCIVAGDFGWWPDAWLQAEKEGREEVSIRYLLEKRPQETKIRFIDGNHENLPELFALHRFMAKNAFEPVEFAPGLWYQPRGSTYTLADGRTVFFCGGGKSVDAPLRKQGVTWFPEEITYSDELPSVLPEADIVVSHTVPALSGVLETLRPVKDICEWWDDTPDETCWTLDEVLQDVRPRLWLAAHLHQHIRTKKDNTEFIVLNMTSGLSRPWREFSYVLI